MWGNFLISWKPVRFSKRTLLCEVSKYVCIFITMVYTWMFAILDGSLIYHNILLHHNSKLSLKYDPRTPIFQNGKFFFHLPLCILWNSCLHFHFHCRLLTGCSKLNDSYNQWPPAPQWRFLEGTSLEEFEDRRLGLSMWPPHLVISCDSDVYWWLRNVRNRRLSVNLSDKQMY
jgi:hypothetical protein